MAVVLQLWVPKNQLYVTPYGSDSPTVVPEKYIYGNGSPTVGPEKPNSIFTPYGSGYPTAGPEEPKSAVTPFGDGSPTVGSGGPNSTVTPFSSGLQLWDPKNRTLSLPSPNHCDLTQICHHKKIISIY